MKSITTSTVKNTAKNTVKNKVCQYTVISWQGERLWKSFTDRKKKLF